MKNTLFTILASVLFSISYAQTVNGVPIKDINVEYAMIVGTAKFLSNKVTIEIDFGQNTKYFDFNSEMVIRDDNNNRLVFNSMIDALNFMHANGFEFVDAYAMAINNQNVYHYLLRNTKN